MSIQVNVHPVIATDAVELEVLLGPEPLGAVYFQLTVEQARELASKLIARQPSA